MSQQVTLGPSPHEACLRFAHRLARELIVLHSHACCRCAQVLQQRMIVKHVAPERRMCAADHNALTMLLSKIGDTQVQAGLTSGLRH